MSPQFSGTSPRQRGEMQSRNLECDLSPNSLLDLGQGFSSVIVAGVVQQRFSRTLPRWPDAERRQGMVSSARDAPINAGVDAVIIQTGIACSQAW